MRNVTLAFPYYNNAEMFKHHWNHIRAYPPEIRDHLEVIIVDDGSQITRMKLPEPSDFKCRFFRTLVDVPWNNPFVRNLSVKNAGNEWVLLTDIDHLVPAEVMRHLMEGQFNPDLIYTFGRTYIKSLTPFELGDSRPQGHLYSFFLTRQTYDAVGGDDERLSGYYAAMETDFRNRAGSRLTNLDDQRLQTVTYNLIHDARTHNLPRKEAKDHLMRRAEADEIVARRSRGELNILRLSHPFAELKTSEATPDNTAVVTIMAYENEQQVPATVGFMHASADRLGIDVIRLMTGTKYQYQEKQIDSSFLNKIVRFYDEIEKLPSAFKYILYVDARDVLFLQTLAVICRRFNEIGWPILMGATRHCNHHVDPGWKARFGKHASGFDFLNAGCWMAERGALREAVVRLKSLSVLVREDKVASSFPPLWNNDQHLWQTGYVEHAFPLAPDHRHQIFHNFHNCTVDEYDFEQTSPCHPLVLKDGTAPCILHFAGGAATGMPFFAWCMNLTKPGFIPPIKT